MKKRLEGLNLFKDKDIVQSLREQIEILNKLLVSKEDDLRSKEEQYVLMQQLWREKEAKVRLQLNERDKELKNMGKRTLEMENELLQKERLETELRKEITNTCNKLLYYQERYKAKVELAKKAEQYKVDFIVSERKLKAAQQESEILKQTVAQLEKQSEDLISELEKFKAASSEISSDLKMIQDLKDEKNVKEEIDKNKEENILIIKEQIKSLSQQIDQKQQEEDSLYKEMQEAQVLLEQRESEIKELSEGLTNVKTQLKEKEQEIKALKEESEKIEKSIEEQQSLAITYSGVLKEKERSLKAKEELAIHFFDLINETEEHIKLKDEQTTRFYFDMDKHNNSLTSNIIENYSS